VDVSGTVKIRFLPEGTSQEALVLEHSGLLVELELSGQGQVPTVGMLLELSDAAAIYLGVIRRVTSTGPRLQITMHVEHYLDRKAAAEMQAAWSQVDPSA
jgi:hypothetical protein